MRNSEEEGTLTSDGALGCVLSDAPELASVLSKGAWAILVTDACRS